MINWLKSFFFLKAERPEEVQKPSDLSEHFNYNMLEYFYEILSNYAKPNSTLALKSGGLQGSLGLSLVSQTECNAM